MKKCFIYPFYVPEKTKVTSFPDINEKHYIIRGMICDIKHIKCDIYNEKGQKLESDIYLIRPKTATTSTFEEGLNLIEKGIGF